MCFEQSEVFFSEISMVIEGYSSEQSRYQLSELNPNKSSVYDADAQRLLQFFLMH